MPKKPRQPSKGKDYSIPTGTPKRLKIREVENSKDGLSINVVVSLDEEASEQWIIPYKHAIWLAESILKVSPAAINNQILSSGAVQGTTLPAQRLKVNSIRLLVRPRSDIAALSAVGTWLPDQAAGTTTLLIDGPAAEDLIEQLQVFLGTVQSISRPS